MFLWLLGCTDPLVEGYFLVVSGQVVDEAADGIGGATVRLGTGDPAEVVAITQADADGEWSIPLVGTELLGNELRALYDAPGMTQASARYSVNLRSPTVTGLDPGPWQTWQAAERRLPSMALAEDVEVGRADATVVDALGEPVIGALVELRRGWNAAASDPVLIVATTDEDGRFALADAPGWWTVSVPAGASWGASRFGLYARVAGEPEGTIGVVPGLTPGWLTLSLTWGSHPLDLDLHLTSPLRGGQNGQDGTGDFHVWSQNPRHPENDIAEAEVELTRMDDDGGGPEIIEVVEPPDEGETRVSVMDNDNVSDGASTQLTRSGAQVQVWLVDQEPAYFTISPGEVATMWRPVEIETDVTYAVEGYSTGVDPTDGSAF